VTGAVGSSCSDGSENPPVQSSCNPGEVCVDLSPNNTCTVLGCNADSDCGTGVCVTDTSGGNFCLAGCNPSQQNPCGRPDFVCSSITDSTGAEVNGCVPNCNDDDICGYPEQCNASSGQCGVTSCSGTDDSCPTGDVCWTPSGSSGACVPDCRLGGNACPAGYSCDSAGGCDPKQAGTYQACGPGVGGCIAGDGCVQLIGASEPVCLQQCTNDSQCPRGSFFNPGACGVFTGSATFCDYTCNDWPISDCPGSSSCDVGSSDSEGNQYCTP
jgi:hypothetical protein